MRTAREVIAGRSYMFTRRCTQRQFLLRADPKTNEAITYCLGVAAERYNIELHSVTAMSNHLCITARDPLGNYPEFLRYVNSLIARSVNVLRSRWENLWSSDGPSTVQLLDAEAMLNKMVYNLTDPVRQHLVDKVSNWPGVSSWRFQLADRPMKAKRPAKFFHKDGAMPDEVAIYFKRPVEFAHLSHDEWTTLLKDRVEAVETTAAAERKANKLQVIGRKAVLRRSPFSCPSSSPPRRNLNPTVAAGSKELRIAALEHMKYFRHRYYQALEERTVQLIKGGAEALFPRGTYQLAPLGLVRCEAAPP